MGNVTFTIAGRDYALACADGEEARLGRLAALIDAKAVEAGALGQTESRMLLFAALMLADELHDLRGGVADRPPAATSTAVPAIPADLAVRLGDVARRVENLAALLESDAPSA